MNMKVSQRVPYASSLGLQRNSCPVLGCKATQVKSPASRLPIGIARRAKAIKTRVAASNAVDAPEGLHGAEELVLPTIFAKSGQAMMKANVVLPPSASGEPVTGGSVSVKARGTVLFLHGFAQGPTAYARMLQQLAASGVVVVAPCPAFGSSPDVQQKYMVDSAIFWRDLIDKNALPGLTLEGATSQSVGLMGHSVGGGLAPFVADACAKAGMAFASAHVLAPQVTQVVDAYKYDVVPGLLDGVATEWGVQYGLADLLSMAPSVDRLRTWLQKKDVLRASVRYELGTHVGFEDQLVVGGESFTTDVLPWVLAVMWGALALWLPGLGLRGLSMLRGDENVKATTTAPVDKSGAKEGSVPSNPGFGAPDDVELPDERYMLAGYVSLAATVTAIEMALPAFAWDTPAAVGLSVLKAVFLVLAVGSWPALVLYPYEATKQRPESRKQAVIYFQNQLGGGAGQEVVAAKAPAVAQVTAK